MKKILLFAALCFATISQAETTFTFSSADDMNQTKNGVTLTIAQGTGGTAPTVTTDYQTGSPEMRVYVGNTITLSGTNLTNIQLVCAKSSASNKQYAGLSESTGTLVSGGEAADKNDWKVDSWTGSTNSVTFTLTGTGQRRIQRIVVGGAPIVIDPTEESLPTAEDLKTDYVYSEPTIVLPKDTTIWQAEYAFIHNNILTHCSQGSIIKETDTTYAYFNCNANYSITFTASQNIKGIAISGFVRKAFNATCDHGNLTFLTDEDFDMEGWPALVITDINSKDVTLYCPKQFRCYELKVYFKENPDPIGTETYIRPTTSHQEQTPNKILINGQLYIQKDGHTYSAQGQQIH